MFLAYTITVDFCILTLYLEILLNSNSLIMVFILLWPETCFSFERSLTVEIPRPVHDFSDLVKVATTCSCCLLHIDGLLVSYYWPVTSYSLCVSSLPFYNFVPQREEIRGFISISRMLFCSNYKISFLLTFFLFLAEVFFFNF